MMTTAWFKVATGGRTGVICQCCTCCCGAMEADRLARQLDDRVSIIIPSGYVVAVDEDKCVACGTCVKSCNIFYALSQADGERPVYDAGLCKGCGVCVEKCPQGARTLVMDGSRGLPLDIDMAKERLG
jgi:Pyruvate/2-oxoacid:ferredoxin oxidoreductase delta subunit